jgi:hypothetical protein
MACARKVYLSTPAGLCGAFSDFARICQEDAMRLEDCSQGYTSPGAYILIAHALELSLKAFLAKHQLSEKELRSRYGHDLDCLYNKAIEVGLHLSVPNPKKTIARVNKYHSENALRYDLSTRTLPAGSAVLEVIDAILREVEGRGHEGDEKP